MSSSRSLKGAGRSTINELVEALPEHEFLGEGELLSELQNDNDDEGKAFEIDGELKRLGHLQSKLARRLKESTQCWGLTMLTIPLNFLRRIEARTTQAALNSGRRPGPRATAALYELFW